MTSNKLDLVFDKLSSLSAQTIQSMDDNIALMSNIINLHETLGRAKNDNDTGAFDSILEKSEYHTEQMQLINLRTKYFEAQLNILSAHTTFNSLLAHPSQADSKDNNDINWRTTDATLENLYLEYHYHTIKFHEALKSSKHNEYDACSTPMGTDSARATALNRKESKALMLKPLRTTAKRNSRLLDSPVSLVQEPSMEEFNDSSMTLQSSVSQSFTKKNLYNILEKEPLPAAEAVDSKCHKRSSSMPETPKSQIHCFERTDTPGEDDASFSERNIRHFISYDTGLSKYVKNEIPITFDNLSIIKESEIVGSYDEHDSQSMLSFESFTFDELDEPAVNNKSSLKRSTSHDSIFQLQNDNSSFTFNIESPWMKKFNQKIQPTVETFNVTAENSTSHWDSLPSEPFKPYKPEISNGSFFRNFDDFLTVSPSVQKQTVSQAKTSKQLLHAVVTNSYAKKLEKAPKSQPNSITIPKAPASVRTSTTTSAALLDIKDRSDFLDTNLKTQWSSFLSKLKPQNLVPSSSVVTSEIGKPLAIQVAPRKSHNFESANRGSYSTLTIGSNHSKTISHGSESNVGSVLSSKVSHAALSDALNDSTFQWA